MKRFINYLMLVYSSYLIFLTNTFAASDDVNICEDMSYVIRNFGYILTFIKILLPAIIIIFGVTKFIRVVINGDAKEYTKAVKSMLISFIASVIIFLIPPLIGAILTMVTSYDKEESETKACIACLTHPRSDECSNAVTNSRNKEEDSKKEEESKKKENESIAKKNSNKIQNKTKIKPRADGNNTLFNQSGNQSDISGNTTSNNTTPGEPTEATKKIGAVSTEATNKAVQEVKKQKEKVKKQQEQVKKQSLWDFLFPWKNNNTIVRIPESDKQDKKQTNKKQSSQNNKTNNNDLLNPKNNKKTNNNQTIIDVLKSTLNMKK